MENLPLSVKVTAKKTPEKNFPFKIQPKHRASVATLPARRVIGACHSYIHTQNISKNVFHPGKINSMSHWTSELSRRSCLNFQIRITAHILRELLILARLQLVYNATFFIFRTFTDEEIIIWNYATGANNVTDTASLSNPRSNFRGDSICKHNAVLRCIRTEVLWLAFFRSRGGFTVRLTKLKLQGLHLRGPFARPWDWPYINIHIHT